MRPALIAFGSSTLGQLSAGRVGHQFRYDWYMYLRNIPSLFFTLFMPVMFLVIFASVFGHGKVTIGGTTISVAVYYVPGIIALGIINSSFGNLAAAVVGTREAGIYKRRRATPVGAATLIGARALVAVVVSLAITVLLLGIGYAYGASIPARTVAALVVGVVVSSLALCCLGFALASVIGNRDAVMPVVLGVTLPLYFISGVFVPSTELPNWLLDIAAVFPVRHIATALLAVYNPGSTGWGFEGTDLAVIAGWGVFGLIVAVRRFSWLPRGG
jgi:ABC-2 type transport system permease protein